MDHSPTPDAIAHSFHQVRRTARERDATAKASGFCSSSAGTATSL